MDNIILDINQTNSAEGTEEITLLVRRKGKKMKDYDFPVNEGELNIRLLVQVLRQQNLPFRVALAEDATSVVATKEYDSTSNRIFGFSLPLSSNGNKKTTFIKVFTQLISVFIARSSRL
jgi:hypothetical protein